jgi:predicted enzyme related to lactoylglutathione lyase
MGERTQHAPGTFSWADLTTTDQDAAKTFYAALFGWEIEDLPVSEGVVYSMARVGGKSVAAISPQPQMLRDAGAPPTWNSYVTVADVDATAARAQELGANLLSPPFDVMTAGRMAVVQDPQGAVFMVWQPRDNIGAQLVNAPGALCWNELATPDLDAAQAFYSGLFGWTTQPFEGSPTPYLMIQSGDRVNGGMRPLDPPQLPPHWLVYFAVDDLDAALARVEEHGGTKHAGPIELPMARIAVVADPQGAMFALYAGQLDD